MLESESECDDHHEIRKQDKRIDGVKKNISSHCVTRKRALPDSGTDSENTDLKLPLMGLKNEDSQKTSTASGTDSENLGTSTPPGVFGERPAKLRKRNSQRRHIVKNEIMKRHAIIKYELIHNLTKYSPDPENFALFASVREVTQFSTSAISQYLSEFAKKSERSMVDQQTDQAFLNLQSWSDYLSHIHGRPAANNPAFVVKMIAETEQHPSPEEVDGVDYK
jgi:hypothetical protein